MCRIAGIYDIRASTPYNIEEVTSKMRDCMAYGGPDNAGVFVDAKQQLGFGHRRLSILDLSAAGNQPLHWNQFTLAFNGECYNFKEVRDELASSYTFATQTDTEVLLKAYEKWGTTCIHKFRGMFAFFLYDNKKEELILCRDRLGVKPLFFYKKDGLMLFSSELKAFHQHPEFDKSVNHDAVSLYLQQGYIQAPHSIFSYVTKVMPGEIVRISNTGNITKERYWNAEDVYTNAKIDNRASEAIQEELEDILHESFKLRMIADVPVGMFLSGGVDSSLVTSLIQHSTNKQVKTFTIGFEDPNYDESPYAKAVAQHIGTDHNELICTASDFESLVPQLPSFLDEPMGDASIIPTHLVAKMAKEQVTVSLSADGGDEIFGGYSKYEATKFLYPKIEKFPNAVKKLLHSSSQKISPEWLDKHSGKIPVLKNYSNLAAKWPKFRNALSAKNMLDFFNIGSSYISGKDLTQLHQHNSLQRLTPLIEPIKGREASYLGTLDIISYLEGDILTKVDRATMQVALEGRDPLLDHKIVEFAMSIPDNLKLTQQSSKIILRNILYKYVPKELIERPKQGFTIPVKLWLQTKLSPILEEMVEDGEFASTFKLNAPFLEKLVADFIDNKSISNAHFMWFLYTLYTWYLHWLK